MKKQLIIIGGGFAGFWSAISAIRQSREIQKRAEVEIVLVNPDNHVTIRPGLNEPYSGGMSFELDKYLKPLGIHQIIGKVEIIIPEKNEVVCSTSLGIKKLNYDYLILAAGASLKKTNLPGIEHTFNVDSVDKAGILEDHIIDLVKKDFSEQGATTFITVGSGFTGLETVTGIEQKVRTIQACYSQKKPDLKIILVESGNPPEVKFSKECIEYIQDVIISKKIEVISNREITYIRPASVMLNDGTHITTRTVIWTKGMVASSLTRFFKVPQDIQHRLIVDQFLKLPEYDNVIAAGNVAHTSGNDKRFSFIDCQFAQFEGRWAGHNAINDLFNVSLKKYIDPGYETCIDLGEPQVPHETKLHSGLSNKKLKKRVDEKYINKVTMYPWQDVEATVKASYPEIINFNGSITND